MTDLESLFREQRPRALAALIRILGDFDLAEDALQDALTAAWLQWPSEGVPERPAAWLVATARNKAFDLLRRRRTLERKRPEIARQAEELMMRDPTGNARSNEAFGDDLLRLIFTCCHPALAPEARTALTLKTLCGLSVEEIARAFLVRPTTMAQRLVRAKRKIHDARIPYAVPDPEHLTERLEAVLRVVYLVFTEGYAATRGDRHVRAELCTEGIRLGRLLDRLLPSEPEIQGLLALMLLHDARRRARTNERGDLVLLEDQDRALWDAERISEGIALAEDALRDRRDGFYSLQAAIAALHAQAETPDATDWAQIAALYGLLHAAHPSPVIELNRAAAVAMADGPAAGLALLSEIEAGGELDRYPLFHSARADLFRRLGRKREAEAAYETALALTEQAPERRFLERRLAELRSR